MDVENQHQSVEQLHQSHGLNQHLKLLLCQSSVKAPAQLKDNPQSLFVKLGWYRLYFHHLPQ
ncbi:Uncharacterised protein [Acinetobacter baumannii]|nr:Uncharacterised protein [Acinetobacter baumannii]